MTTLAGRMTWTLLAWALAASTAVAQPRDYGPHMWGGGGWFGWFIGPVMMVALIAIIVAAVVLVVRWLAGPGQGTYPGVSAGPPVRTPLDILKERYARGEIDREEYEERKRVLGE